MRVAFRQKGSTALLFRRSHLTTIGHYRVQLRGEAGAAQRVVMRNSTRFSILGPVQIRTPVTEITVAAPRERILLALLLLREGQLVPVQQVIAALWDTNPPT